MTTTHTPQPPSRSEARRYEPGHRQVPTPRNGSLEQPLTVVEIALVPGDAVTATSTALPAVALQVHHQTVRLASVHCTQTRRTAGHVMRVVA